MSQLLLLSAASEAELDAATARLADHLDAHPDRDLADVAVSLAGQPAQQHRRMLVASDRADAVAALRFADAARLATAAVSGGERSVAFLFSGQGSQYAGMGRGLYGAEPVFREAIDRCCAALESHLGLDLRDLLFPGEDRLDAAAAELEQTRNTQPALFVVEYAAARLWQSWGLTPAAMLGHSIGEYTAACLAGVFTLEEALALVAARGRLMQSLPAGSMLAVPLPEEEVQEHLDAEISLAAVNAPNRSVVSGPSAAIAALQQKLRGRRVMCRELHTSHAFHSVMMEPILAPFVAEVRNVALAPPRIPYVSNDTGAWITAEQATDPEYWARHLRHAVRFAQGVSELLRDPRRVLLEVGPGNTLTTLAQRHPDKGPEHLVISSIRHPKEKEVDDLTYLLGTVGQLWLAGVELDVSAVLSRRP